MARRGRPPRSRTEGKTSPTERGACFDPLTVLPPVGCSADYHIPLSSIPVTTSTVRSRALSKFAVPSQPAVRPLVRVAVPVPLSDGFDYLWTAGGAPPPAGARVRVPFGKGERVGIVLEHPAATMLPADKLKPVLKRIDARPVIGDELLATLRWASHYYHHPIGEVLSHALPTLLRKGRSLDGPIERAWQLTPEGGAQPLDRVAGRAPQQARCLSLLSQQPLATETELRRAGLSPDVVRRLTAKGWIEPCTPDAGKAGSEAAGASAGSRTGSSGEPPSDSGGSAPTESAGSQPPSPDAGSHPPTRTTEPLPDLTADQTRALDAIAATDPGFKVFLLHGVTASGKTEIFLRLIREQLDAGRQTLLLVPEISLTPQLVERLSRRFGEELAILHSGLTDRDRHDAWRRAYRQQARLIVGTRSAVFAPLPTAGLIIVDEEHDPAYKQERGFRYSARDLAVVRARRLGVPVLLASATPSLESYRNALERRYRLLTMPKRIGAAGVPSVRTIDLNMHASRHGLSTPLVTRIDRHLERGDQVLLFLNRRGFAPVLFCAECTVTEECGRCDARMTVHAGSGRLRCHHCGREAMLHWTCPTCGNERVAVGAGTQRVSDALKALYPDRRIARLDRDVSRTRGALATVLGEVERGETDIIVGTQMLTKGHDFPRVTLVGIVNADQGLLGTDFRSEERLAQTIVQVAGRAGRRDRPGEVVIQTHYPRHALLAALVDQDYAAFAKLALAERRLADWPPYSHVAVWRAEAHDRDTVYRYLRRIGATAREHAEDVRVLGPAAAPMERLAGRYRAQLILQSGKRPPLHRLVGIVAGASRAWPEARRVRWAIDIDPNGL